MGRVSFGQNFEDVVLWRALGHLAGGRYLDIGAQHPEIDSVSLSFYKDGWRGVHVEPTPQYAALLREARADEVVIEAAVGDGSGLLDFYVFPDTGLSTGSKSVSVQHSFSGLKPEKITVPIVSLESLLNLFDGQDLHWLKIDVEGMEQSVLRSWGQSTVRPWIVVLEAITPASQEPDDLLWRDLIEGRDYHEVLFDGINRFFVANEHAELDGSFSAPANCLDQYYVPWHHWSAANVVHQFRIDAAKAEESAAQILHDHNVTSAALADAINQRDTLQSDRDLLAARLEEVTAERAVLSNTISGLNRELTARSVDLARLQEQHRELLQLSQSLAAQLDAANSTIAVLMARHDEHLRSAFAEMRAMREQIAVMSDDAAQQAQRLRVAESIVDISKRQLASWPQRLVHAAFPSGRRSRRRLRTAIALWNTRSHVWGQSTNQLHNSEANLMSIFAFEQRNPYLRADSLEELCSFADADFVRCAYVTILGRQPDPDGERRYVSLLRNGASKIGVIADLRLSNEGQRHDPGIAGLDKNLRRHRNANLPVFGWIIRLLTDREGNSPVERRLRALTNMFELEQNRAAARAATANHLQLLLDQKVDGLHKELRSAIAGQSTSPRQIGQAEAAGDTEWEATLRTVLHG